MPERMEKAMKHKSLSEIRRAAGSLWRDWRWQLKNRITSPAVLAGLRGLAAKNQNGIGQVLAAYPMLVTPYYLSLISDSAGNDPIARQCLPDLREITCRPDYPQDPLEEDALMPVPKLVHRYPDRALAMVTGNCATYCRHCNRKRFWREQDSGTLKQRVGKMAGYIANNPQIREVIVSGGDPLTLSDEALEFILAKFSSISHVEVLRIGSRAPAVLPMRITRELCRLLKRYRPLWFNTQFNHPAEITKEAARACNMLAEAGIPVSNQSVLLRGINDSSATMRQLVTGLQKISVRPYYLFHCEPVRGTAHFRTDAASGVRLMEELAKNCSGLALPRYVADLPGEAGKIPLWALSDTFKKNLEKHQDFFDFSK